MIPVFEMAAELVWFNLLSLAAGFFVTLLFVWKKPKRIWLLAALAAVLFLLFGIFSIPGFLLALGVKAFFSGVKRESKGFKKELK